MQNSEWTPRTTKYFNHTPNKTPHNSLASVFVDCASPLKLDSDIPFQLPTLTTQFKIHNQNAQNTSFKSPKIDNINHNYSDILPVYYQHVVPEEYIKYTFPEPESKTMLDFDIEFDNSLSLSPVQNQPPRQLGNLTYSPFRGQFSSPIKTPEKLQKTPLVILDISDSDNDDESESEYLMMKRAQMKYEQMKLNRKAVFIDEIDSQALDIQMDSFAHYNDIFANLLFNEYPALFSSLDDLNIRSDIHSLEDRVQSSIVQNIRSKYLAPLSPRELKSLQNIWYPSNLDPNSLLTDAFNFEITPSILSVLRSGWLTDHIMDFYAKLITIRGSPHFISSSPKAIQTIRIRHPPHWPQSNATHAERSAPCSFCWNSFFYTTLSKKHTGFNFKAVSRWTISNNVDVTVLDFMIFPIHLTNHWTLAVVDFNAEAWHYLDSLGGKRSDIILNLKKWLKMEVLEKFGKSFLFENQRWSSKIENWKEIYHGSNSPQQHNGADCGVFAMITAKLFADGITEISNLQPITQRHMPLIRQRMTLEIVNGRLI